MDFLQDKKTVAVVGAGPAGLMAAEVIAAAGHAVQVYDAMPSAARKFLLAGIGGLNITHSEPYAQFINRYYEKSNWLDGALRDFDGQALRQWVHGLGVETFVGTSGRVFPAEMKAAPLLRKWLKRLRDDGVEFYMRHRLVDLAGRQLVISHDAAERVVEADAVVLALGGASWPKLGSDGGWCSLLASRGVAVQPLVSANCGFLCPWSDHLTGKFSGSPLKNIAFRVATLSGEQIYRKGECIVSHYGMEGSLIYAVSKYLRDGIAAKGFAELTIDLLPDISGAELHGRLQQRRAGESLAKQLKRTVKLDGIKAGLLYECCERSVLSDPASLAAAIKAVPLRFTGTTPIEEAISSAGGICEESVNGDLMLTALPGVFCAGEMLDWEAPTGGYLLTGCFATGRLAGQGVCRFLAG